MDNETPDFESMTDRELLLSMAKDSYAVKQLIANAVEQMGPLLASPKLRLAMKMFG